MGTRVVDSMQKILLIPPFLQGEFLDKIIKNKRGSMKMKIMAWFVTVWRQCHPNLEFLISSAVIRTLQKREEFEMRRRDSFIGLFIILGTILIFSNNAESLTINSNTFKYYANIPTPQACPNYGGTNKNPQLSLSDIPSATQAFAMIMDDPDAPGGTYLHWLMYWNSPAITSMNENSLPAGAVQGINDGSTVAYFGPCPPSNHRYFFRVYALDKTLSLSAGFTRSQLESAMAGHILESNFGIIS